jgi:hypothetical protein
MPSHPIPSHPSPRLMSLFFFFVVVSSFRRKRGPITQLLISLSVSVCVSMLLALHTGSGYISCIHTYNTSYVSNILGKRAAQKKDSFIHSFMATGAALMNAHSRNARLGAL